MADDVIFTGSAPGAVKVGQQFRLTYTINSQADHFIPPDLNDFIVLSGPNTSSNSSFSIINGKMTQQYQLQYLYILQAGVPGSYKIEPATITVNRKKVLSNPVQIEVVADKGEAPGQKSQSKPEKETSVRKENIPANAGRLFVRILVNKRNAFLGESLVATIKIY
jgi:hypothetical protein